MDHMKVNPKYKLNPYQSDRFSVEILEDEYRGVAFLVGRIHFSPIEGSDEHRFEYEYEIIENPENKIEDNGLKKMIGDIIMHLLDDQYNEETTDEYDQFDGRESDSISGNEE